MCEEKSRRRALVLGGGGSAGNAWLIGVLAGLLDGGIDATHADLIIGTSAGATAAAQVTARNASDLLADIEAESPPLRPARSGGSASRDSAADPMAPTNEIFATATDLADLRRRLGAAAMQMDAETEDSWSEQWRRIVARRLPSASWPDTAIALVAVDARTGEPVVFDRDSGVDLVDAVAASCSIGVPHRIGDDRYIDGGYRRSSENADLAAGSTRVLVLSPLSGRTRAPLEWGLHLAVQADELRAGGSTVEIVLPDAASLAAFGTNMMDLSARPPAARAGYDQGRALAGPLTEFWT